jgi:tetratricopeptide (TPR) repeat protein
MGKQMKLLGFCLCLILYSTTGFSQDKADSLSSRTLAPTDVLRFARFLYDQKNYGRALLEYKRYYFIDPRNDSAAMTIGLCYKNNRQYRQAESWFRELNATAIDTGIKKAARDEIPVCCYLDQDYRQCLSLLEQVASSAFPYRFLMIFCYIQERNWAMAQTILKLVNEDSLSQNDLLIYRTVSNAVQQVSHLPKKSPAIGALLSLVPGAGNMYAGRYGDGFFSLVMVGGAYAASYWCYHEDNRTAALLTGGTGFIFHLGNIFGSAVAAKAVHETAEDGLIDALVAQANKEKWFFKLGLDHQPLL